jgi:hypothetical protein
MNIFDFEQHIKNKLSQKDDSIDINRLLIDLDLAPKKDKNRLGIWIFSGLLVAAAAYSVFYFNSTDTIVLEKNAAINTEVKSVNTIASTDKNQIAIIDKTLESSTNEFNGLEPKNQNTNTASELKNNISQKKRNVNKNENTLQNQLLNLDYQGSNIITTNEQINKNNQAQNIANNQSLIVNIETIEFLKAKELMQNKLEPNFQINCPSFNDHPWSFSIIPEIGYLIPIKTLENTSQNTEVRKVFEQRKSNEKSLEGLQLALYGKIEHNSGVYLKAGLSYTRIAEMMSYQNEFTTQDTTIGIISITESENKDTLTVIYGDIITTTTTKQNLKKHYYFHQYDLPIAIGYSIDRKHFTLDLELGLSINLRTEYSGYLYAKNDNFLNLENEKYFKKSVGIGVFGGVQIRKYFQGIGELYFSPRIHLTPSSYNSDINFIDQNYTAIAMHLGYIKRF